MTRRPQRATDLSLDQRDRADLKALKQFIELKREQSDGMLVAVLEQLAAKDATPIRLRHWLIAKRGELAPPAGDPPWDLCMLAMHIKGHSLLTAWERLPAKTRARQVARVTRLAAALAHELRTSEVPIIEPAMHLFEPALLDAAFGTGRQMRVHRQREIGDYTQWSVPSALLDQQLVSMLDRLSLKVKDAAQPRQRDTRPNTRNADQRAFARHLADWFWMRYESVPNGVVADLVNLFMSQADPPATDDSVREWRGAK